MTCPICKEDTVQAYRPFCSRRCSDIDLGRWFSGAYAVPSTDEQDADISEAESEEETQRPH